MRSSTSSRAPLALAATILIAAVLIGAAAAVAPAPAVAASGAYPDVPLVAHTGGFGEPTCHTCHFDSPLNPAGGGLEVEGWPDKAEAGQQYEIAVRVRHEELARGGFQLAVRSRDGRQAGKLKAADERAAVTPSDAGIAYAHHTLQGTSPAGDSGARWVIVWTAPAEQGDVVLHVAANAANGDRSEFGDFIYADSLASRVE